MLTEQQHKIFTDCVREISLTALKGYCELSRTVDKLNAYNMLLEPPATIREANSIRARQLRKQAFSLQDLWIKADKADEYVTARPSIHSYDDGKRTFVLPGLLPNFEHAPEDEEQALAAVDAYHAREAQAS